MIAMKQQEQNTEQVTRMLPQPFSRAMSNHVREHPTDATESRAGEAKIGLEGAGQPAACGKQRIGRFKDPAKVVQPKIDEQQ